MYVHVPTLYMYIYVFQDMQRLKAHELLEKETIKASALRHKLANLPHKLKAELTGLYKRNAITSIIIRLYYWLLFVIQLLWHLLKILMQPKCTLFRYALLRVFLCLLKTLQIISLPPCRLSYQTYVRREQSLRRE